MRSPRCSVLQQHGQTVGWCGRRGWQTEVARPSRCTSYLERGIFIIRNNPGDGRISVEHDDSMSAAYLPMLTKLSFALGNTDLRHDLIYGHKWSLFRLVLLLVEGEHPDVGFN